MSPKKDIVKSLEKKNIFAKIAARFSVDELILKKTLSETVFKGATEAQTITLLIVADQYGLNPFTKEIYAFPSRSGGIVPIVGIDGWLRIINEHPQYDGMDFEQDDDECTCKMHRKDRKHPTVITEYFEECKKETDAWKKWPKRMLRHKSIIQCARVAFGFVGIYDEDEGRTIAEAEFTVTPEPLNMPTPTDGETGPLPATKPAGDGSAAADPAPAATSPGSAAEPFARDKLIADAGLVVGDGGDACTEYCLDKGYIKPGQAWTDCDEKILNIIIRSKRGWMVQVNSHIDKKNA